MTEQLNSAGNKEKFMPDFKYAYYKDTYLKELEADVLSCKAEDSHFISVLSDTVFYPEGGGQPCDLGTIDGVDVYDVQEKDGTVWHYTASPLQEGKKVLCRINWERRFDFMQNHSGEHIVSGLIHRNYGFDNVGFHMGEMIQIDFNGELTEKMVKKIELAANDILWKNVPINTLYPSKEEADALDFRSKKEISAQLRLIEIPQADLCACCGTHVSHTGEIGLIKILSAQKHKKGTRLEMLCGRRAFEYLARIYQNNQNISVLLSSPAEKTDSYVKALLQRNKDLEQKLKAEKERVLFSQLDALEDNRIFHLEFIQGSDRDTMRRYADRLVESGKAKTAAVLKQVENGYEYVIISHSVDLKASIQELNVRLCGRGGGGSEIVQGTFTAGEEEIRNVMTGKFH